MISLLDRPYFSGQTHAAFLLLCMLPLSWYALYVAAPILLLAANCLRACFKLPPATPLHLELVDASPHARAGKGGYIAKAGYTI
jgi:hypothetical protein